MAHHVAQQVGEDLGEAVAVTDDLERGGLLAGGLVAGVEGDEAAVALGGQHHHVAEGPGGQVGEVDRLHRHLPALVDPGQLEEIVDEAPHPVGLGLDAPHDLTGLVRGHPAHPVELAVAADGGQGGAQLVGGIGDEARHPLLGHDLGGEGALVLGEHRVDRPLQRAHLRGARLGDQDAGGQVTVGDPCGHALDLAQGTERAVDQVGGEEGAHRDDRDVGQGHHEAGALDGLHDVAQREGQGHRAGVLAGVLVPDEQGNHPPLVSGLIGVDRRDREVVLVRVGQGAPVVQALDLGPAVRGGGVRRDPLPVAGGVEVLGLDVVVRGEGGAAGPSLADLGQSLASDGHGGGAQLAVDLAHHVAVEQRGHYEGDDDQPDGEQASGHEGQARAQWHCLPGPLNRGDRVPSAPFDRAVLLTGRLGRARAPPTRRRHHSALGSRSM